MEQLIAPQFLFIAGIVVFLTVIAMHLIKKSISVVYFYVIQSSMISLLLLYSSFVRHSFFVLAVTMLITAVKIIIAPGFFLRLIKKNELKFSASSYLNMPMTLIAITIITAIARSRFFHPLTVINPTNESTLLISIAAMLISLFMIINRKGALSQMIGVLSLENSIVSFAFTAGLEQKPGLELGITFDIFVWIIIATVFVSMVYKKFKTLDVTEMSRLKG